MILTKSTPYTREEITQLREQFDTYIKTVIDVETKLCAAGADRHADAEKVLLDAGSQQENLWGGGIDLETMVIDVNSMINIRPSQGNTSNEIQDPAKRTDYETLTKYFFKELYGE